MPKQILTRAEARNAIMRGVDQVADVVKVTLGPRGRNVMIDRPGQPLHTRDGVTVAKEVASLADPFEQMGAMHVREVADAAVQEAGDGTTTATVLLQAIAKEGIKLVQAGANPLALASGIDIAADAIAVALRGLAIEATAERLIQVATVSTHGDIALGRLVGEALAKVGTTGKITLAEAYGTAETTLEHVDGFHFERGWWPNTVFVNDQQGQKVRLENPLILVSERILTSGVPNIKGHSIHPLMAKATQAQRPLLIIAENVTGDAMNLIAVNQARGVNKFCVVRLPAVGEQKKLAIRDLAIAVGARRVHTSDSTAEHDLLTSFELEDLGQCDFAEIGPRSTLLLRGGGAPSLVKERVRELLRQQADATNPLEKETIGFRIARLAGGVAVIRVGAATEPAMIELKARIEDAVHASEGARESGIVPGGGLALMRAAAFVARDKAFCELMINNREDDFVAGVRLLLKAVHEPMRQIAVNAAQGDGSAVVTKCLDLAGNWGYNAATGCYEDLALAGVVDPLKVVLTALQKAASLGGLLLTTEALVTDLPELVKAAADFRRQMGVATHP